VIAPLLLAALLTTNSPAELAHDFYERYGAGDVDGVVSLADPSYADALRRRIAGHLRTRCIHLLGAEVHDLRHEGAEATAHVDAVLAVQPRGGIERIETHDATLELKLTASGWRVTSWRLREEAVADAIVAAATGDERARIVSRNAGALTPLLDALLAQRALQFINQSRHDEAAALTELVLRLAAEIGDDRGLADATGIECVRLRHLPSRYAGEALRVGQEAVALAEKTRDPDVIARAQLRLGRASLAATPWTPSKAPFERVLEMADDVEDPSVVALAASQLSGYYGDHGFLRLSLAYAELSRAAALASGNDLALSSAETNIGMLYDGLADNELAILHLTNALRASERAGYPDGVWGMLAQIARCYRELGNAKEFLRYSALALKPGAPADTAAVAEEDLVAYYLDAHDLARAEEHAKRALTLAEQFASDSRRIMTALVNVARVQLARGRSEEVLATAQRIRDIRHDEGDFETRALAALALRRMHRNGEAVKVYQSIVNMTEEGRDLVAGDERQRRLFFATREAAYRDYADLLVEQGDVEGALAIADESKGRTLLDALSHRPRAIEERMTDADRKRERELVELVATARDAATSAAGLEAMRQARIELDSFRAELRTKYDPAAPPREAATLTPARLARLLPGRDVAFVEYVITGSRLHAFVIRRGTHGQTTVRVRSTSIERAKLERTVSRFARVLASRDLDYRADARRLHDLLLQPIARDLEGVRTIGVIADGVLWRLPFEALLDPRGRFAGERYATFYAPSLAVYARMSTAAAHDPAQRSIRFVGIANPKLPRQADAVISGLRANELVPLPDAEREVTRIAKLYGPSRSRIYVGAEAREEVVKEEKGSYDVIHFATHGVLDDTNPMYSHLLLARSPDGSDDGLLEAWEMMRLDLHADLAVLSACETARGRYDAGEGMIGMSWALFTAGCPSTIATEWKVDSAAAADLMVAFYKRWLASPAGTSFAKAAALQRARLDLLRDPRRRHPFYWAPYVLIGSGR
jgi:CHAT domain-containing protein